MRQVARWPGGHRKKDGTVVANRAGVHEFCSSGACEQGAGYRARLGGFEPPRHSFYRPGSHEQQVALRLFIRSNLEVVPDIDHPPGAPEAISDSRAREGRAGGESSLRTVAEERQWPPCDRARW